MFVSTSAVTLVELLARPATIAARRGMPGIARLPLGLPACGGIEDPEPLLSVESCRCHPRRHDPDDVPGRLPKDLVTGPDGELIGNGLGQRDLQLAGDLRHGPYSIKDRILVQATLAARVPWDSIN